MKLDKYQEEALRLIWEESRGWLGDGKEWTLSMDQILVDLKTSKYAKNEVDRILRNETNKTN